MKGKLKKCEGRSKVEGRAGSMMAWPGLDWGQKMSGTGRNRHGNQGS